MLNLAERRNARGITQQELADVVKVTRQMISAIENGASAPSVDLAKEIGKELDFDWWLLYPSTDNQKEA